MKREINIKNKRTRSRIGRVLCAATAAAVSVFGFGSCAALEMLDKLAAEEENAGHFTTAAVSSPSAEEENKDSGAGEPAASEAPVQQDQSSAQGEADSSAVPANANGQDTSAASGSPDSVTTEQKENIPVPDSTADSNGSGTAAPDSIVSAPETVSPGQQPVSTDSSLFTDLTGSSTSSSLPEGSGDLYTPGNFSPDTTSSSSSSNTPDVAYNPANAVGGSQIYLAYSELVDKYASYVAKDPSFKAEFCRYYITDIDDNGVSEILIETGTIETDRTIYVYTFDGREAELLGNFVAWHTRLGDGPGVMYTETSAMGSYIVSTTRIQDGKLFTQREEQPFSESQITVPIVGYPYTNTAPLEALRG